MMGFGAPQYPSSSRTYLPTYSSLSSKPLTANLRARPAGEGICVSSMWSHAHLRFPLNSNSRPKVSYALKVQEKDGSSGCGQRTQNEVQARQPQPRHPHSQPTV